MFNPNLPEVEGVAGGENLTLRESAMERCLPIRVQGGRRLRAYCPYHGSDHQRSLAVDSETGAFKCFGCGAWGYMDWAREGWAKNMRNPSKLATRKASFQRRPPEPSRANLAVVLQNYQDALPGSIGEEYLHSRGITLELARRYGLGYAPAGKWAHQSRDWKCGRVVFPEHDPQGNLINLYGRAVEPEPIVPKEMRHDHLPGSRGYFNASTLQEARSIFISEGAFDALSLIAAGNAAAVAIFGVDGWRWEWASRVATLVLAFDADTTGQKGWREIARQGRLRGKRVFILSPEAYGGSKDANEAWVAGNLKLL